MRESYILSDYIDNRSMEQCSISCFEATENSTFCRCCSRLYRAVNM